ncbi:DUF185 domain-containing protein [Verticillium dahliae VDG2]|nr:DUF185 domain-containing protein [Verticillium dahliae VDG2]
MAATPSSITLRSPSKYTSSTTPAQSSSSPSPPTLDWLHRTWTVTHSTLTMWRTARNVRITYKPLPSSAAGAPRLDDLVEYEPTGAGLLFFVSSHWEVLGCGERPLPGGGVERWAVTWFAPTLFTKEGVDVYCDRSEGISEEAYAEVLAALRGLEARAVVDLVEADMRPVEIRLPWLEGGQS